MLANIHKKIRKMHAHTYTEKGNQGVDLVSTTRLDKADYPQCGVLGPWFGVCFLTPFFCVNVHIHLLCIYC